MEVLVSIIMISGFLATAMQALISATAIKVRSEEISEATSWMQQDLEALKFEANRLDFDPSANDYIVQSSRCDVDNPSYAEALRDRIGALTTANPMPPYAENNQDRTSAFGGRSYKLERTLEPSGNMLAVSYEIYRDDNGDGSLSAAERNRQIGELYSEIIPDAALYCERG